MEHDTHCVLSTRKASGASCLALLITTKVTRRVPAWVNTLPEIRESHLHASLSPVYCIIARVGTPDLWSKYLCPTPGQDWLTSSHSVASSMAITELSSRDVPHIALG